MAKTKILHLITSLNIGGTEKFLLTVLKNLGHKYDFSVGYLKKRGRIADEIEILRIPIFKFNFSSLKRYIKAYKTQIIHTHLYRANILGRIAGKLAGVPAIISSQRSIDGWKKFYHVWLDKFTSNYCSLIVTNSDAAKKVLETREGISAEMMQTVQNYAPPELLNLNLKPVENISAIGCVTRLHREKGVYLIPEIAKLVSEKNNNIKFLIYGDGPEKKTMEFLIEKYNLQGKIKFYSWKTDLEKIYNSFNIMLLPSEEESFPQAALEAMSCGIPVIAADVGGVSELVENRKTGILIKDRNPESFADAILSLAGDPYCYSQFSENSKMKAKNFTLEKMVNAVDEIYGRFTTMQMQTDENHGCKQI
ncbi:MAG: glycosyltransferase [Elusimicrobia bacterium]|nr:glycosyltransferase [Elusimicrobiota bacterium]